MAEKKRSTLTQRIGMGVFLGILGVGVGLGVYDGFDAKKEKTPVVRDVEVKEKTVHNKDKNDPPSTLVEAVHKDKNGRVLIRVLGKDKEEAERLLSEVKMEQKAREKKVDEEYRKSNKTSSADRSGFEYPDLKLGEKETYAKFEKALTEIFEIRLDTDMGEVEKRLSAISYQQNKEMYLLYVGDVQLSIRLSTDGKKLFGTSVIVRCEDLSKLRAASAVGKGVMEGLGKEKNIGLSMGTKQMEEKKVFSMYSAK